MYQKNNVNRFPGFSVYLLIDSRIILSHLSKLLWATKLIFHEHQKETKVDH